MERLEFLVEGSQPEPYRVIFEKDGLNLSGYCTCPAGENGMYCKHRFGILDGSSKGVVNPNKTDIETVASWLPGTDVGEWLEKVRELEQQANKIKSQLSAAKKMLAKAMRN